MQNVVTKYRRVPLVYDVLLWDGKNQRGMYDFLTGTTNQTMMAEGETFRIDFDNGPCSMGTLVIKTKEGDHRADVGDYIVKGVNGEFWPCKPAAFHASYEPLAPTEQERHERD